MALHFTTAEIIELGMTCGHMIGSHRFLHTLNIFGDGDPIIPYAPEQVGATWAQLHPEAVTSGRGEELNMRLAGKVAVVTGGTRGVGRGIARRFAESGAKVVIAGRSVEAGTQVEKEIRAAGGDAFFVRTDISSEEDCRRVVAATEERYGRLTTFVHNAAATHLVGSDSPIADARMDKISNQTMDEIWRSDLYGLFWCLPLRDPLDAEK